MSKLFSENNKSNNKIEGHNLQNKFKYLTDDELLSITTPHRTLNFRGVYNYNDLPKDATTGTVYSLEIEEDPKTKKPKIYKDSVGNILSTGDIVVSSGNNQWIKLEYVIIIPEELAQLNQLKDKGIV